MQPDARLRSFVWYGELVVKETFTERIYTVMCRQLIFRPAPNKKGEGRESFSL